MRINPFQAFNLACLCKKLGFWSKLGSLPISVQWFFKRNDDLRNGKRKVKGVSKKRVLSLGREMVGCGWME